MGFFIVAKPNHGNVTSCSLLMCLHSNIGVINLLILDNRRFAGRLDIRNNVVYNFGNRVTDGGARQVNFVGNLYKQGPASSLTFALRAQASFGRLEQHNGVNLGTVRGPTARKATVSLRR